MVSRSIYVAIPVLGLVLVALHGNAASTEKNGTGNSYAEYLKPDPAAPMFAAREYSLTHDAVGIFIKIGPGSRYTPEQLGKALKSKFEKDGIAAHYVGLTANAGESQVDFFVRGIPYAGYGMDRVNDGYQVASRIIRANQHSNR